PKPRPHVTFVIPVRGAPCPTAVGDAAYDAGRLPCTPHQGIPLRPLLPLWSRSVGQGPSPHHALGGREGTDTMPVPVPRPRAMPAGGGREEPDRLPVPVPGQRARPAGESGQAQAEPQPGIQAAQGQAPRGKAPSDTLTLLVIEDDPTGPPIVPEMLDSAGRPI